MFCHILTLCALAAMASGRYTGESGSREKDNRRSAIVMQTMESSPGGSSQYAFASDNGHQQSENINADGSRTGAYSYIDPSGQKVAVRYVADNEGFHILEGDHVPKPSITVHHTASSPAAARKAPVASNQYGDKESEVSPAAAFEKIEGLDEFEFE